MTGLKLFFPVAFGLTLAGFAPTFPGPIDAEAPGSPETLSVAGFDSSFGWQSGLGTRTMVPVVVDFEAVCGGVAGTGAGPCDDEWNKFLISSPPVSARTELMGGHDDHRASECYDWQNWERRPWWSFRRHYRHELKDDGDQLVPPGWRKHSVVRAQGPPHTWWEPGKAEVVHLPCEDDVR